MCRRMSSAMSTFISPLTFLAAAATLCRVTAFMATMLASISKTAAECSTSIMEKFGDIHDQLVSKIAALAATPASAGGEAIPLRIDIPATASIELWDSGLPVSAHAGDTLATLAVTYHVPLWALTQVNNLSEDAALTKGQHIIVPRYLVPMAASSGVSSHAASNRR